ncbi:MAG: heavy-metal-associated domain-containing protein [Vicinamibacterales bacterium]
MRKALAIMGLLSAFGFGSAAASHESDKPKAGDVCVLKVSGMACGACAVTVEKAARKIDGVLGAKVSQPKGKAEITYAPEKTSPEAIAKTISEKTAFKAEVPPKDQKN